MICEHKSLGAAPKTGSRIAPCPDCGVILFGNASGWMVTAAKVTVPWTDDDVDKAVLKAMFRKGSAPGKISVLP